MLDPVSTAALEEEVESHLPPPPMLVDNNEPPLRASSILGLRYLINF
jgi:hypothetical protein